MINLSDIRNGLENGEFFLEYLPTISLKNNRCVGAEALIRWRRSSGIVPPLDFIPIAEETPLSGLITYWVIETVMNELGDWLRSNNDIHLSLNIPPEILGRGGLEYVANKCGLIDSLDKIIIEITERGIPDKIGLHAIETSHNSGLRIALDDVWVDKINPVILCRSRIDILKIDKTFMDRMLLESWSPKNILSLSNLIKTSEIEVIAEGVESSIQVEILKDAGIQMAQGWYFSKSLSAEKFQAFFSKNQ